MGVLKKKEPTKFTEQYIRKRLQLQAHSNKIDDCKLNLQEKFYYAFKNYENRCENNTMEKELQQCKDMINFLKTEYKAATGNYINEIF